MEAETTQQYRRFLLNRVTATASVVNYIDQCTFKSSKEISHSFHKIMVHSWSENEIQLFQAINQYFESKTIPVCVKKQRDIISFYTNNINFICKIVKSDFMFPHLRNMYNIDILLNDKTSNDCFNESLTISDIISNILSKRFDENMQLDLSDFCNDPEFKDKNITFYNLSNLFYNQITLINTLGKETKTLNLSNNNLSQVPVDVLNYFVKGNLIAVNLSNNNISSIADLTRMSSKIEKLWLEGNPLCEEIEPTTYVKQITMRFPRLIELDGVKITNHGITFPFFRNFLNTPDKKTRMVVGKFLTLFFTNYDCKPRKTEMFYDDKATFTMHTGFTDLEDSRMCQYSKYNRNIMKNGKNKFLVDKKIYMGRTAIMQIFHSFPETLHDPTTFTVDVLTPNKKSLIIIVDGTFKEINPEANSKVFFRFRRTFIFNVYTVGASSVYQIIHEMFSITPASKEQIEESFKVPIRNLNSLNLIEPDEDDKENLRKVFCHLTQLKKSEAEARLLIQNWDIRLALKNFEKELKFNNIPQDKFLNGDDDDFSDRSSLLSDDDEID